tara:strand:+ start:10142 stop:10327 length:186 start_codon:yes stop_codon:yes gene_type:complete
MVLTRNKFNSQALSVEIFVDAEDLPVKKHIEFKGVERQRDDEKKEKKEKPKSKNKKKSKKK